MAISVKLQMEKTLAIESRKRDLIEETVTKLNIGEGDLQQLEKIRGEVWKTEKRKLRLNSS